MAHGSKPGLFTTHKVVLFVHRKAELIIYMKPQSFLILYIHLFFRRNAIYKQDETK